MREEILKILSMVKSGLTDEAEAADILEAMYGAETETEQEDKQTTVIRNYLPWDDDDALRIAAFRGHKLLDDNEAYREYKFSVHIDDWDINDIASCCGDIYCNDILNANNITCGGSITCDGDLHSGNVACGNTVSCDTINGTVSCGNSINCDTIDGDVSCGCNINCDTIEGDVSCGMKIQCDTIQGNVECKGSICVETVEGNIIHTTED